MKFTTAINLAISEAEKSTEKHKIGAVIYERSKYCTAHNRTFDGCTITKQDRNSDHAEALAITRALHTSINFKKSTLIVVRINSRGKLMLAKPCRNCQRLIRSVEIPITYYSNDPFNRKQNESNFKSLRNR